MWIECVLTIVIKFHWCTGVFRDIRGDKLAEETTGYSKWEKHVTVKLSAIK